MNDFNYVKAMTYSGGFLLEPDKYFAALSGLPREQFLFISNENSRLAKGLAPSEETPYLNPYFVPSPKRTRRPGGGRKKIAVARPECLDIFRGIPTFKQSDSAISYAVISVREIARQMKQAGHSVSPATVKSLAETAGWHIHPSAKIPKGHRRRDPDEQFPFVNGRIRYALAREHDVLFIGTHIVSERNAHCPASQLLSGRHRFMSEYLQSYLNDNCSSPETKAILLVVEAGGLLGIGNRTLRQHLQTFADQRGKTVGVSLLPNGITRMSPAPSTQNRLRMLRGKNTFGEVDVQINRIIGPCSENIPHDDQFKPDSWNYTIYPQTHLAGTPAEGKNNGHRHIA